MSIGFYDENAEDFFQRSASADMAPAYGDFLSHVPPGGRILDAGCGSGRDALAFHRRGFRVTAMEAAPNLAELARAHTGLPVEVMTFADVAWREQFDGVWACASLLHVPAADLPDAVGRLRDALKRGGVFWMSFKYGRAERDANGRRFTDLDEAAGRALVVETGGLDLLSVKITEDVRQDRPGERWLSLLAKRM
ncbi:bifunctional 2-polyprenyl-6-hydroxyphenol methylase/3-demethylubiquinol 3-O-methyltransferase UbiG [Phenylobacterium sp. J367]|uniref:class I SAM-dependent methyltransferase n=1 Tax=Phenylobacterium sp. J367 TaxID=2898435 RepID=UPI002150BEB4|nr:class I SAM-dependent methyltransferase [Phenylobacterium sp. J367]MCR5877975.1 methyltransferase domain-containing protein [Phenylobacterium sp. J367]